MAEESAVKVCVRVRPRIARDERESPDPARLYWRAHQNSIHQTDDGSSAMSFSFALQTDRVFRAEETTRQLFQDIIQPLVASTVEGYNGTVFAYGQAASGKTFTMMGSDHDPGVIPLAVEEVFQTIANCPKKQFLVRVSYMEIYNETVNDLLVDEWKRVPLEVQETVNKSVSVAGLTEEVVASPAQALALLRAGEETRHYESTPMNQRSSRSHTIFKMILESQEKGEASDGAVIASHLDLVDLAGSERASQTGTKGPRFKEDCSIKLSLLILGQVIKKLARNQTGLTDYSNSKLTQILRESLGGNAKTVVICTVIPEVLSDTLRTLQFARAAKQMKNDPRVTKVTDDSAQLKRCQDETADPKKRRSKRKAGVLTEVAAEFESHWIPDESEDVDMSPSTVTVRSCAGSVQAQKLQEWEQKDTELQQARREALRKQKALEEMELKVAELESRLARQVDAEKRTRKKFHATLQICEGLSDKVFKAELEQSIASDKHQEELQRMTMLLSEQEQSLWKMKQKLRRSHQEEEAPDQGKAHHARLGDPRGPVIMSRVYIEKVKLEKIVKVQKQRIMKLESLLSHLTKWKGRADTKVDKPFMPGPPAKRARPSCWVAHSPEPLSRSFPEMPLDDIQNTPGDEGQADVKQEFSPRAPQ